MNTRILPLILISFILISCVNTQSDSFRLNSRINFNQGWSFSEDSINWRTVSVPHDFSIERKFSGEGKIGPFMYGIKDSVSTGSIPGGTGWYKKTFSLKSNINAEIKFDGVMTWCEVWINGIYLGSHHNGYFPFSYDISPYLNRQGEDNTILVKAINTGDNSRWYSGSGIYRSVWLIEHSDIYIPDDEFRIKTSVLSNSSIVKCTFPVINNTRRKISADITLSINDNLGHKIKETKKQVGIDSNSSSVYDICVELQNPKLWSVDNPNLYKAYIKIESDGKTEYTKCESFGIRHIEFSPSKGLLVNNVPTSLKGACIHHDNGLLGAAAHNYAEERKIRLLKENGFNAIRTSHNPPSTQLLEACDRMGMMVIDEAFDVWKHPKRDNDFHLFFDKEQNDDIAAWVKRDSNHPCVIMWSIGNEIYERADTSGLRIASMLRSEILGIDDSRPITQGVCSFWDNKNHDWNDTPAVFDLLDVCGYNYGLDMYENDNKEFPKRIIYGSESFPTQALDNNIAKNKYPFVIGDFVWTGMDYIGEVGIGNSDYVDAEIDIDYSIPTRSWPWFLSNCGDLDINGTKKPQSFYRDVVWGRSNLELEVQAPIPYGKKEIVSKWGWRNEDKIWNWEGHENEVMTVSAYSNCDSVKLYLNGKLVGCEKVDSILTATFHIPYTPGKLTAKAINDGRVISEEAIETTGKPNSIVLSQENTANDELIYIDICIVDEDGRTVKTCDMEIELSVTGDGILLAAGNASPNDMSSFRSSKPKTYKGKCLAIIQPTQSKGLITVSAFSKNLPSPQKNITIGR